MSLEILGLDKDATEADVLARYKDLAKEAHPDRGGSAEKFQQLQDARDGALNEVAFGKSLATAKIQVDALRAAARGTLCPRCHGSGTASERKIGFRTMRQICRLCRGRGRL